MPQQTMEAEAFMSQQTMEAEALLITSLSKNDPEKVREALQKFEDLGLKDRINFIKEKQKFPRLIINGQGNIEQKMAIIKLLSANEINITEANAKGDNLISLALKKGDVALMQAIYEDSDFDFEKLLQQAVKKIQSIKKQPASCFSCLSSGNILTINFVKEANEFRSRPSVEVKLENKLRTKLQEVFDEKDLAKTGSGLATAR
jgi:type III secretion system FlhB-like substrate exporter